MRIVTSLLVLCTAVIVAGCTSMKPPRSVINDVSVSAQLDSGYTVVAVDGKKVTRAPSGKEANVAPVVVLEPGKHTLSLEPKTETAGAPVKIEATLEPARTYRIGKQKDGSLALVEHGVRASELDVR